ncbi:TRAP transporter permease [Magnetofaba australis]|uniref:Putative TRAP-type transport system permease n=1 Tax=Magnetofaba australis IT-1 TaxID=1434232 RepID=A0A1Y2K8A2_9PROT|nr:TRAP transporter fused permease subunit [Magnetofaba australis]OSM04896.1 putative TRAP-type transport system permease [Magnetofaba australis IT-1]
MGVTTGWSPVPESIAAEVATLRQNRLIYWLCAALAALHFWFNSFGNVDAQDMNIIHFAGFALLCGLLNPLANARWRKFDIAFALLTSGAAIYLIFAQDPIYARGVKLIASDWIFGVLVIVAAIEYTRRATGWIIPVLIILSLSYITWWGELIPGVFRFAGLSLETTLFRSIYGDDALFGSIARISATFVFMFILFGAFLLRSGAGDFVIHLSRALAGRMVGGPGVVAVIASGLTGTISGSAIANTASTGVITIPMMKKAGFPARFAAGVEAAASTGGQLMPPIMGAGAFVMASYTQIDYGTIVAVSLIPALLYFFSLAFYIRFEAFKQGLTQPVEAGPAILPLLFRDGLSFVVPVTLLIGMLMWGFTPVYAGAFAILAVIVSSWFTPKKMGPRAVLDALAMGARNMVTTAVLLCAVGLVVNVIATAGIGNTFSLMITEWAGGSLLIAIVLVALASLVLGMGLPVTASYIVLATLSAPALFALMANGEMAQVLAAGNLGDAPKAVLMLAAPDALPLLDQGLNYEQALALIESMAVENVALLRPMLVDEQVLTLQLLAAHMIIFWLSQDSNVTPPVCLCSFTAATIAKTPPMATGFTSWKLAKGLYVVPVLFAYTPILTGGWFSALEVGAFALLGLYAFASAMQGHFRAPLGIPARALMTLLALALLWPLPLLAHVAAAAVLIAFAALLLRQQRARLATSPVPG